MSLDDLNNQPQGTGEQESRIISPDFLINDEKSELMLTKREALDTLVNGIKVIGLGSILAPIIAGCGKSSSQKTSATESVDVGKDYPEISKSKIRLEHPKYGTVYVWHPAYKGDLNDIVVHFHGYDREPTFLKKILQWRPFKKKKGTKRWTIDDYWNNGQMEDQFRSTGLKNLFIMPRSARDGKEPVQKDVGGLLEFVQNETGINTTNKDITVTAHSGGGFTVPHWLNDPRVNNVVMYDALYYTNLSEPVPRGLHEWVEMDGNRLIVVSTGGNSRSRHEEFVRKFNIPALDSLPVEPSPELCPSRVIHLASKESHGGIIYGKETIRRVLKFIDNCKHLDKKASL